MQLWPLDEPGPPKTLAGSLSDIAGVSFLPQGNIVALELAGIGVQLRRVADGTELDRLPVQLRAIGHAPQLNPNPGHL